ncbi:hypothetical protein [Hoeflea sp.]|uniref:hypothetical protein n=1 Tax=Hoeflea sp. TaxID=1940281 RepID=UPI003B0140E9
MDTLQAKAAADMFFSPQMSEEEYYRRHSCDWLQFVRSVMKKIGQHKAPKRYAPESMTATIEH